MNVPHIVRDALQDELRKVGAWKEPWLPTFHEAHLSLAVGHALLNAGASYVVPECHPPSYEQKRCDLFAKCGEHQWFIEFKKGCHGNEPDWARVGNTEQLRGWLNDVVKLRGVEGKGRRVFVILHTRQGHLGLGPEVDLARIGNAADLIAAHLESGGNGTTATIPRMSGFELLPMAAAVFDRIGHSLPIGDAYLGEDFDYPGQNRIWERRVLVGWF